MKGSLVKMTKGVVGEATSVWVVEGMTPSWGVGVLVKMGVASLTLSI